MIKSRRAASFYLRPWLESRKRKRRKADDDKPQKIPLVMSPDETRRLLAVASNLKVRTLLSLGYGCGLRASEWSG